MSQNRSYQNADIYLESEILNDHALLVKDGLVAGIVPRSESPADFEIINLESNSIAPGFVDLQVNGGGGILFNSHQDSESVKEVVRAHQRTGATSIFPTCFTPKIEVMPRLLETLVELRNSGFQGIAGINFEGPVINPEKAGVHDRANIQPLTEELIQFYESSARLLPTLVTLAPEQIEVSAITRLRDSGVRVMAGHSNATYEVMFKALRAGLHGATHLFNAMSGLESRKPGVVGAILADRDAYASIILDGHHLHWASFRAAYKAMAPGKLFFVTDAMPCVGSELSEFNLGSLRVLVKDGRCTTVDGTLAGSALTMELAVQNAIKKVGVPRPEALRMATAYPARFAGLSSGGRLEVGQPADFVVFSKEVKVREVYLSGQKIA